MVSLTRQTSLYGEKRLASLAVLQMEMATAAWITQITRCGKAILAAGRNLQPAAQRRAFLNRELLYLARCAEF